MDLILSRQQPGVFCDDVSTSCKRVINQIPESLQFSLSRNEHWFKKTFFNPRLPLTARKRTSPTCTSPAHPHMGTCTLTDTHIIHTTHTIYIHHTLTCAQTHYSHTHACTCTDVHICMHAHTGQYDACTQTGRFQL